MCSVTRRRFAPPEADGREQYGKQMNPRTSRAGVVVYALAIAGCVPQGWPVKRPVSTPESVTPACAMRGAHVINLSQSKKLPAMCGLDLAEAAPDTVADCIESDIRKNVDEMCLSKFDVFVPGTAAEDGAWKQFNVMFREANGRAHLSLQYGKGGAAEAAQYDRGVIDARASLKHLLYTLNTRFGTTDVRVFGHSKGSHAVALVALDQSEHYNFARFFAFAQPGRTQVDIDSSGQIVAGRRGRPGHIEKLTPNLVGITWANDEVQYYLGSGKNGLVMPETWAFPGLINDLSANGTVNTLAGFRIDHHNNYGGDYVDGVDHNKIERGEGSTEINYPYCMAGSKRSWRDDAAYGCSKRQVRYQPFFWGNPACQKKAFDAMTSWDVGARHRIGSSGPKGAACQAAEARVSVTANLKYLVDLKDEKHCDYRLRVRFQSPDGRRQYGEIKADTGVNQPNWRSIPNGNRARFQLPNHFRIRIDAQIVESNIGKGLFKGDCASPARSKAYIRYLKMTFVDPGTGKNVLRYPIRGWDEGFGYVDRITGNNNVAWKRVRKRGSDDVLQLYKSTKTLGKNALKISTEALGTTEGRHGSFYKEVHLFD